MEKYICKIHNLNPDNLQSEKNLNFTLYYSEEMSDVHAWPFNWLTNPSIQ